MESPLCIENMNMNRAKISNSQVSGPDMISTSNANYLDKMSGSLNSSGTLDDDSTPSDSGVQTMDSDTSEFMIDSFTSQTCGLEYEVSTKCKKGFIQGKSLSSGGGQCTVFDNNSNITERASTIENTMTTSQGSTFDTTENIVYRRKVKKVEGITKAPKKRVSFHEDILKNTRTDNIHIEHGFITYKAGIRKFTHIPGTVAGRYSWCSEGDKVKVLPADAACNSEEYACADFCDNDGKQKDKRHVVYRNACSDVLDYGNSDIYDINQSHGLQYDNSGIFEYMPNENRKTDQMDADKIQTNKTIYPECFCSNSSSDSDDTDKNSNCTQYTQAKSVSCDCIESTNNIINNNNNNNNNVIGDNCYFSEPNIGCNEKPSHLKSVWNKEKKPKSSCLKKNTSHTNVIPEHDLNSKVKKFNVHDMNQLLDNSSKMIFGSLKSIFTIPLPERGVPEGSEDVQSVIECVPDADVEHLEQTGDSQMSQINTLSVSPPMKPKPFLSKSLDGSKKQQMVKQFIHNVDEQLRHRNETELYTPSSNDNSFVKSKIEEHDATVKQLRRQQEFDDESDTITASSRHPVTSNNEPFRNKFIINCESTVFEHTGVSYTYEGSSFNDLTNTNDLEGSVANRIETSTPLEQSKPNDLRNTFITAPLAKTFSNFFRSLKDVGKSSVVKSKQTDLGLKQTTKEWQEIADNYFVSKMCKDEKILPSEITLPKSSPMELSSTISEISSLSNITTTNEKFDKALPSSTSQKLTHKSFTSLTSGICSDASLSGQKDLSVMDLDSREKLSRHLPSPLKKRTTVYNYDTNAVQYYAPQRYCVSTKMSTDCTTLAPDIFNMYNESSRSGSGRDSKNTILSDEYDDILTITTDTDKNDTSDIVILDYPESEGTLTADYSHHTKLAVHHGPAKTSLINRFLRNVTEKKILETSIKQNQFFATKMKTEKKLFNGDLYVKGVKPRNLELIDDLNAEIAMEIEACANKSPQRKLSTAIIKDGTICQKPEDAFHFELGINEVTIDVFLGVTLNFFHDPSEQLIKVFKLYTGYTKEGFMTPVLVFLTDKTLYVTDLVRNRLCSKFILSYKDLDVILMGPYGSTILLSNSTRDMQQVLLTGGSQMATNLIAHLEICARRNGSILPAVGQLTVEHLVPLKRFVHENSCIDKNDPWLYYAIVNIPGFSLGESGEQEPLGPHAKGFLMHRHIKDHTNCAKPQPWNTGYFLLKAGVLYMFNDSAQKIPSWAVALAECQGARRTLKAQRPHCFEILLKDKKLLQLAAPDEYVASEWLQALLQTASGLFEMQEKHKTLGCTVIITGNYLITLREDFSTPLRQNKEVNKCENITPMAAMASGTAIHACSSNTTKTKHNFKNTIDDDMLQILSTDNSSLLSSTFSTPTRGTLRSCSSINSTPTKLSQTSRSTITQNIDNTTATNNCQNILPSSLNSNTTNNSLISTTNNATAITTPTHSKQNQSDQEGASFVCKNQFVINSVYGNNCGIEILTCANIQDMVGIKVPSLSDTWWCTVEFSYQEVRECSDDLVIFFANNAEMQRFLKILEEIWKTKHNDSFPLTVSGNDDIMVEQCTTLYMDINRAWEPLLSAALGYPL